MRGTLPGVLLLAMLASACTMPKRSIQYALQDEPTRAAGPLSSYRLAVEPFADARPPEERERRGDGWGPAVAKRDGDDWYVNSADQYETPDVAGEVTAMIANHLRAAGLFREVAVVTPGSTSDLLLTGTLGRFEGWHDRHLWKEAFLHQAGLVGLVLGVTTKVRSEGNVLLSGVRLTQVQSGRVLWEGDVEAQSDDSHRLFGTNPWNAYEQANTTLKLAVRKLIEQLESLQPGTLEAASPPTPPPNES